jgi:hypothetical protein
MIGGRDAGAAADHDPGPRGFMVMLGHARHIAAQACHDLAGAASIPFAFFLLALPPEPQHVGIKLRGRDLRRIGECGALRGGRARRLWKRTNSSSDRQRQAAPQFHGH